jgi:hypothetical protein
MRYAYVQFTCYYKANTTVPAYHKLLSNEQTKPTTKITAVPTAAALCTQVAVIPNVKVMHCTSFNVLGNNNDCKCTS